MTIIKTSRDLKPHEAYEVTLAPDVKKMSNSLGQTIEIDYWALYQDVNNTTGAVQEILAIKTLDGDTLATNSPTFIADFGRMVEMFDQYETKINAISIVGGKSKAGRDYITCRFAR